MARLRGCLPILSILVVFVSCVESSHRQLCHRVFPLELTATAMPCRYICAYYTGYTAHYRVRGEDDGTPCRHQGTEGVCWSGMCLTRYGQEDEWSQHADATSKVPLRIRKRDVSTVTKGVTVTKTGRADGDSFTTKTVKTVNTLKTNVGSEDNGSGGTKGFKGTYMTTFSTDQTRKGTKNSLPSGPTPDVDPFAKNPSSTSRTTESFLSSGSVTPTGKNGRVTVTVNHGPNGQKVTTRTVRRLVITKGPTKTVRRIVFRQGSYGGGTNLMLDGRKTFATKTISVSHGSLGGTSALMAGGNAGVSRTTSQITLHTTKGARHNPISSIVRSTIKQERVSGGQNAGGASTATKTVSTVAVTKSSGPSLSVVKVTKQGATPMTAASVGTTNTATLRGVEVEVPGYTAGLRHNWKWVLARRVGVYPPYVQALDPDVLYDKLGLRKPNLPSLPRPVLNILNGVPVHPVGSDLYGYLLSSKIMEKIRGLTDGVNGLTRLRSLLSTTNNSNEDNSNVLKTLFSGTQTSPLGSTFLTKLLLSSLSGTGSNILKSPYSSLFGGSYAGLFGSPWQTFSPGQFPAGSWPFYNTGLLGRLGPNPAIFSDSPFSPFGSDDSLVGRKTPTSVHYTSAENGGLLPSSGTPSPQDAESLLGDSSYIKSVLSPMGTDSYTREAQYGQSHDESLERTSEKLAQAFGEEKLRQLLKISSERNSPVLRILKSLYRRHHDNFPMVLRRLGVRPHSRLYNKIIREIVLRRKHDILSPSRYTTPYGEEPDKTQELIEELRDLSRTTNYDTIRHLKGLRRSKPRLLESFESTRDGSGGSNNKLSSLIQLLLERKQRLRSTSSLGSFDRSGTELIDTVLDYPRRHPSTDREAELSKQITKALLTSHHGPISTDGSGEAHLSRLISVHGTSHTEKRPQGLTESQVVSTAYHSNKVAPTTAIPNSPVTASGLEMTRQITQATRPGALLGMNSFPTTASSSYTLQPYPQFVSQQLYLPQGTSASDQGALTNRQFVSSTGSMYGSPLGQPSPTMVTGTGGYTGYATMPTSTAYISQYAAQPYYVGTSLYGSHPHYIVEGHEAPGTRWQLRVWRHHPGVSYVAPGYNGFQSSQLGSFVTRARETVTRGLHSGSQPGQLGFTEYGSTVPGGNIGGVNSQYVVRAPDGRLVLSRQPVAVGSPTQGAAASSVVVSQITKQTTKTTSGSPNLTLSGGFASSSFQSAAEGASSGGTAKSDSLSELTQNKETSLFKSTASGSGSENTESLFSSGGSSSGSLQPDEDLSQSKLRR